MNIHRPIINSECFVFSRMMKETEEEEACERRMHGDMFELGIEMSAKFQWMVEETILKH